MTEEIIVDHDALSRLRDMADCMHMIRQELIEAGIIDESIAPMFVSDAVINKFRRLELKSDAHKEHIIKRKNEILHLELAVMAEARLADEWKQRAEAAELEAKRFAACRHQARHMQEDGGEKAFVTQCDQYIKDQKL